MRRPAREEAEALGPRPRRVCVIREQNLHPCPTDFCTCQVSQGETLGVASLRLRSAKLDPGATWSHTGLGRGGSSGKLSLLSLAASGMRTQPSRPARLRGLCSPSSSHGCLRLRGVRGAVVPGASPVGGGSVRPWATRASRGSSDPHPLPVPSPGGCSPPPMQAVFTRIHVHGRFNSQ